MNTSRSPKSSAGGCRRGSVRGGGPGPVGAGRGLSAPWPPGLPGGGGRGPAPPPWRGAPRAAAGRGGAGRGGAAGGAGRGGPLNPPPPGGGAAADVPVLGELFQVLTVRSYTTEQDQAYYQVKVPEVDADGQTAQRVNQEIQKRVDAYIAEYQAMWKEYREAFLATGGTEEEWAKRSMDVIVDYQIMSQTDTTVSFMLDLSQCSFSAAEERHYYNLNLAEDRDITLEELLGEDWVSRCNRAVQDYIAAHTESDGFSYFFPPEDGGFTTVDDSTSFYIRQDGAVVLSFPRYSIAAGAAGIVEVPVE